MTEEARESSIMELTLEKILFFIFLIFTLTAQVQLWNFGSGYPHYSVLKKELNNKVARNKILELENNAKLTRINNLKSSIEVIEEEARENFAMIKPGEVYLQAD